MMRRHPGILKRQGQKIGKESRLFHWVKRKKPATPLGITGSSTALA